MNAELAKTTSLIHCRLARGASKHTNEHRARVCGTSLVYTNFPADIVYSLVGSNPARQLMDCVAKLLRHFQGYAVLGATPRRSNFGLVGTHTNTLRLVKRYEPSIRCRNHRRFHRDLGSIPRRSTGMGMQMAKAGGNINPLILGSNPSPSTGTLTNKPNGHFPADKSVRYFQCPPITSAASWGFASQ